MPAEFLNEDLLQHAFRYALSLTHDEALAEDLVQEASVSILSAGGPLDRGYFFTVLRNRFIDGYRRQKKFPHFSIERTTPDGDPLPEIGRPEDLDWQAPDVLANGALHRALGQLRPDDREIIYLTVVEGYTAQEIADMTDRPRGTILAIMFRAKRRLREMLEGTVNVGQGQ
jgi:RNA polymerase sigma-70 factor (ECF subfamily)